MEYRMVSKNGLNIIKKCEGNPAEKSEYDDIT